jgi:hypothetical protein
MVSRLAMLWYSTSSTIYNSILHKKVNYVWVVQADMRELARTVKKICPLKACFSDIHGTPLNVYEGVCIYVYALPTMHSTKAYALKGQKLCCEFF